MKKQEINKAVCNKAVSELEELIYKYDQLSEDFMNSATIARSNLFEQFKEQCNLDANNEYELTKEDHIKFHKFAESEFIPDVPNSYMHSIIMKCHTHRIAMEIQNAVDSIKYHIANTSLEDREAEQIVEVYP